MFFDYKTLCRNGKFAKIWIAATHGVRAIKRAEIEKINIVHSVNEVIPYVTTSSNRVQDRHSLRLMAKLLSGIVRIYGKQVEMMYKEIVILIAHDEKSIIPQQKVKVAPKKRKLHPRAAIRAPEPLVPSPEDPFIDIEPSPAIDLEGMKSNAVANQSTITLIEIEPIPKPQPEADVSDDFGFEPNIHQEFYVDGQPAPPVASTPLPETPTDDRSIMPPHSDSMPPPTTTSELMPPPSEVPTRTPIPRRVRTPVRRLPPPPTEQKNKLYVQIDSRRRVTDVTNTNADFGSDYDSDLEQEIASLLSLFDTMEINIDWGDESKMRAWRERASPIEPSVSQIQIVNEIEPRPSTSAVLIEEPPQPQPQPELQKQVEPMEVDEQPIQITQRPIEVSQLPIEDILSANQIADQLTFNELPSEERDEISLGRWKGIINCVAAGVRNGMRVTIDHVADQPLTRRTVARAFQDLLILAKIGYLDLITEDHSTELSYILPGRKLDV